MIQIIDRARAQPRTRTHNMNFVYFAMYTLKFRYIFIKKLVLLAIGLFGANCELNSVLVVSVYLPKQKQFFNSRTHPTSHLTSTWWTYAHIHSSKLFICRQHWLRSTTERASGAWDFVYVHFNMQRFFFNVNDFSECWTFITSPCVFSHSFRTFSVWAWALSTLHIDESLQYTHVKKRQICIKINSIMIGRNKPKKEQNRQEWKKIVKFIFLTSSRLCVWYIWFDGLPGNVCLFLCARTR